MSKINGILMFHVYIYIIVWIYVLLWICHLHLFSFGSIYVLLWMSADITERRSTHVRIRIHGRARTSIARVVARFLNSGTTAALTIPIYYKYID